MTAKVDKKQKCSVFSWFLPYLNKKKSFFCDYFRKECIFAKHY